MTGEELLARFSASASSSLSLVDVVAAAVVPLKRSVAHCLTLHPSPSCRPRFLLSKKFKSSSRAS